MPSLCMCATQWHMNTTRTQSRDRIELRCAPHFDVSPLTYPPRHHPTRQGASPPPHSHPQIRQHETAANKPSTSCSVFSASSLPTSSTALTRYTGAHTWERACRPPSSTAGGRAFIWSCACTVGFVTRHGGCPGRRRVKDDDGGDEFRVCGVQPVPRPVVCTVPSRATAPPPPSTRRHRPLHTAAAAISVPPLLPLIAGLTTGRCLYVWCRPCPWPLCTRHTQPRPLGAHIAVARVSPTSTPLTRAHAPPLCTPRVLAPSLAPSAAVPRVLAPIACALASRAPSAAVPHVSAPVVCALASWAPSAAM